MSGAGLGFFVQIGHEEGNISGKFKEYRHPFAHQVEGTLFNWPSNGHFPCPEPEMCVILL